MNEPTSALCIRHLFWRCCWARCGAFKIPWLSVIYLLFTWQLWIGGWLSFFVDFNWYRPIAQSLSLGTHCLSSSHSKLWWVKWNESRFWSEASWLVNEADMGLESSHKVLGTWVNSSCAWVAIRSGQVEPCQLASGDRVLTTSPSGNSSKKAPSHCLAPLMRCLSLLLFLSRCFRLPIEFPKEGDKDSIPFYVAFIELLESTLYRQ